MAFCFMVFSLIWTILAGTNVVHISGAECISPRKARSDSLCANGDQRRVDVGRGQVGVEVREHFAHPLVNVGGHFRGKSGKFNFILTFVDEQLIA